MTHIVLKIMKTILQGASSNIKELQELREIINNYYFPMKRILTIFTSLNKLLLITDYSLNI